jgi:hypothetical protein
LNKAHMRKILIQTIVFLNIRETPEFLHFTDVVTWPNEETVKSIETLSTQSH